MDYPYQGSSGDIMTTIEHRLNELGTYGNKVVGYAVVSSMLNIMSEALDELGDDELLDEIDTIQQKIYDKQKDIMNTDIR